MATVIRTRLSAILPVLKARLMAVLALPAERVLLSARRDADDEPHPQADQYVRVKPVGAAPTPDWDGGGRVNLQARRTVRAALWTRLNLDDGNTGEAWLTHASLGHLDQEHLLFDALAGFWPTDGAGNALTVVCVQPGPAREPEGGHGGEGSGGWGRSAVEFEVTYVMALNQSDPAC